MNPLSRLYLGWRKRALEAVARENWRLMRAHRASARYYSTFRSTQGQANFRIHDAEAAAAHKRAEAASAEALRLTIRLQPPARCIVGAVARGIHWDDCA